MKTLFPWPVTDYRIITQKPQRQKLKWKPADCVVAFNLINTDKG